ncbi:1-phosphofructokinase [Oceanimonas smirnovii]|uniref:Phosphofructokinase n=1 Tax=Oceanimonas smirnovii TaxID=264574 RepID=A0ABW7NXB0_9GAMM
MSVLTLTLNPALDLTVSLVRLTAGQVNVAQSGHLGPAGKGINVARVLSELGHRPVVSGFLGRDNESAFCTLFEQHGMQDEFIRVAGNTRINVKVSEQDGRITDINLPGLSPHPADVARLQSTLTALSGRCQYLIVAGSLPAGVSPGWLEQLLTQWRQQGKDVWLDTSGEALKTGVQALPGLIKPNLDELAQLAGRRIKNEQALISCARQLQQSGIKDVVVSAGADGVYWFGSEGDWRGRVPAVNIVSTVGAGDSLVAGLCAGRLEGLKAPDNLRRAMALSLMAVTQIGVGIYCNDTFAGFQQAIQITPFDHGSRT